MIVNGSLIASGNESAITLSAQEQVWKGVYVLNADTMSRLRHVHISKVKALEHGILKLTGAVSFYRSSVVIENCTITEVEAGML